MTSDDSDRTTQIPLTTLARRGGLAVVASLALNWVVLWLVLTAAPVQPFDALSVPPVTLLSAAGAVGATLVYAGLSRRAERPDRTFVRIAIVVLVLSFAPDLALLAVDPDATVGGVIALMVMHVTVAASCVWALTDRYSPIDRRGLRP